MMSLVVCCHHLLLFAVVFCCCLLSSSVIFCRHLLLVFLVGCCFHCCLLSFVVVCCGLLLLFFDVCGTREKSPRKAVHMARGNINPITLEVMDMYSPSKVGETIACVTITNNGTPVIWTPETWPFHIQATIPNLPLKNEATPIYIQDTFTGVAGGVLPSHKPTSDPLMNSFP